MYEIWEAFPEILPDFEILRNIPTENPQFPIKIIIVKEKRLLQARFIDNYCTMNIIVYKWINKRYQQLHTDTIFKDCYANV